MTEQAAAWESPQPELLKLRLRVLLVIATVAGLAIGALLLYGNTKLRLIALLIALLLTVVLRLIGWYLRASLRHYRFVLLDDGVLLESGVLWRSEVFVPRVRIQHTDVAQGPVARRLQLATLVLHTSGVKQAQLEIVGLRPERARQLRDQLLVRELRQAPSVDETSTATAAATESSTHP